MFTEDQTTEVKFKVYKVFLTFKSHWLKVPLVVQNLNLTNGSDDCVLVMHGTVLLLSCIFCSFGFYVCNIFIILLLGTQCE